VATQRRRVRRCLNAGAVRGKARHGGAWGLAVERGEVSDELFERWAQAAEAWGGVLLHGQLEWRAARHGRARGRGDRLNRGARLLVMNV
jgi:hypothetical protein